MVKKKRSHHEVLGVSKDAGGEEIERAYHEMMGTLKLSKDASDPAAREAYEEIAAAYEALRPRGEQPADSPGPDGGLAQGADEADPVHALRQRVEELEDAVLRARAETQNIRRRAAIEQAEAIRYANADLMKSLLGVLDDLDRALEAGQSSRDAAGVIDGVRLVRDNLLKGLGEHGLSPIDARNDPFDPEIHEALLQQPTDAVKPGTVIEEIARGYRLRDRVLRPARVIVSRAKDPSAGQGDDETTEADTEASARNDRS